MSRTRFENLDSDRQQRLLDSAAEEFAERGYEAASLNRILAKSGFSKSSLYYYFEDKSDLFTTLIERSITFVFRELGGFNVNELTADSFWPDLEALMQKMMAVLNRNAWYVRLGRVFYRLREAPGRKSPGDKVFLAARHWMAAIILRGQELGVIRMDLPESLLVDYTMALGEALDRWILAHWEELSATERVEFVRQQLNMFQRLLSK